MYCTPACKACREAGICSRASERVPAFSVPITRNEPHRAFRTIDLPPMPHSTTHLECEHTTSREIQLIYSVWRNPQSLQFFCERCGDWQHARPARKPVPLPDNPSELF